MQVSVTEESDVEGAHNSHSTSKQEKTSPISTSGARLSEDAFHEFLQVTKRKKRRLSSIMLHAALHPITGDVIGSNSISQTATQPNRVSPSLMELCFKSLLNASDITPLQHTISTAPRDVLVRFALYATTGQITVNGVLGIIEAQAGRTAPSSTKTLPIVSMTHKQATMVMELIKNLVSSTSPQQISFGASDSPVSYSTYSNDDEMLALRYCQLVLSRYFKCWDNVEDYASSWIELAEVHRLSDCQSGTRIAELFYISALIQLGLATREQRDLYRSERLLQHAQELCLMRLLHAFNGTTPTSADRTVIHSNEELLELAEHHQLDLVNDGFARKTLQLYLATYQHLGLTQLANSKPDDAIRSFETAFRTWNALLSPLHATQPACQCCSVVDPSNPPAGKPGASCPGLQYNLFLLSLAHRTKRSH